VTVRPLPRRALAIVVTVAALTGTACDSERRAISRDDLPDVPAEPDHVVELGDDGFDTDELEVLNSDLVEFRIVGEDDHGVRADTRIDTGLLFPGESTFVIFDEPGTYEVVDVTDDDQVLSVESVPDPDEE
jgi:plastocyanin